MTKISVYIPAFNYEKYIEQAVESVLKQTMKDWELIVINDGSTDNTVEVLKKYKGHDKIRILDQENKGLPVTNNIALRLSRGEYVIRLDGDDYMDENLLLVLSNVLDTKPDVGLVYPDYYHVGEDGEILEVIRRKKIGEEAKLLDLPAHGACTMFRKDLLLELGGYHEDFSCQDGYELWLRFIQKYKPINVNLPLFYYRQHPSSLTQDQSLILDTRRQIKSQFVARNLDRKDLKVLGIILATGNPVTVEMDPFQDLAGKPLIWYTMSEALKSQSIDKFVLSTDDDRVLEYSKKYKDIQVIKRPVSLMKSNVKTIQLAQHALAEVRSAHDYEPDAAAILYINTPIRKAYHIDKAVNTMKIFDVDTVLSIVEELAPCYQHEEFGLTPINEVGQNLRLERKSIYKENGAIYLMKTSVLEEGLFLGKKVGHITMLPEESVKINSAYDLWLAEELIQRRSGRFQIKA